MVTDFRRRERIRYTGREDILTSYPPEPTPIDDARPPAFHHWNVYPKKWENLGARLLDADPRTKSADLFEIGGVAQYGIDAIGDCATGGGCIVSPPNVMRRRPPPRSRIGLTTSSNTGKAIGSREAFEPSS